MPEFLRELGAGGEGGGFDGDGVSGEFEETGGAVVVAGGDGWGGCGVEDWESAAAGGLSEERNELFSEPGEEGLWIESRSGGEEIGGGDAGMGWDTEETGSGLFGAACSSKAKRRLASFEFLYAARSW